MPRRFAMKPIWAKIWQKCNDEHPDRIHLALIEGFRDVAKYNFPKGSLVIIDEFRARTEGLADLVNRVKDCGAVVVILVQTFLILSTYRPCWLQRFLLCKER